MAAIITGNIPKPKAVDPLLKQQLQIQAETDQLKERIRDRQKAMAIDILEMAIDIYELHERLLLDGLWMEWIEKESGLSRTVAYSYKDIGARLRNFRAQLTEAKFGISVMEILADQNTPAEAISAVVEASKTERMTMNRCHELVMQARYAAIGATLSRSFHPYQYELEIGAKRFYFSNLKEVRDKFDGIRERRENAIAQSANAGAIDVVVAPAAPAQLEASGISCQDCIHFLDREDSYGCGKRAASWGQPIDADWGADNQCEKFEPDEDELGIASISESPASAANVVRFPNSSNVVALPIAPIANSEVPDSGSTNAQHSSSTSEWYISEDLAQAFRDVLGGEIELDIASCDQANRIVKAGRFLSKDDNALMQPLIAKTAYCNPPGGVFGHKDGQVPPCGPHKAGASVQAAFFRYVLSEYKAGRLGAVVFLAFSIELLGKCPEAFDYPICFTTAEATSPSVNGMGRIKFLNEQLEAGEQPSHMNAIIFLPPRDADGDFDVAAVQRFFEKTHGVFGRSGLLMGGTHD